MRTIMPLALKDSALHDILNTYITHNAENRSVLAQCASANTTDKGLKKPLSEAVVTLAVSDALPSMTRNCDAAAIQPNKTSGRTTTQRTTRRTSGTR